MLDCGEIMDISQIKQWYDTTLPQLDDVQNDVLIDVSSLQKIDTTGIQLLTAVVRYVENKGKKVIWSELSPAFINAATMLGLQNVLGMTPQQSV